MAWPLCEALLALLAVSDETCAGVAAARDPVRTAGYRFRARADELLARSGSLSRIPAHRLRVLPKVRIPPGGISFRSLSRYLCLRGPAVDVAWHKVPARRAGLGQQQANVLLLPWPLRIRQRDFVPQWSTVRRGQDEPFGTFSFEPAEPFDLDLVERVLRGALDEVDAVDAVVLPESCVPAADLEALEAVLGRYGVGGRRPARCAVAGGAGRSGAVGAARGRPHRGCGRRHGRGSHRRRPPRQRRPGAAVRRLTGRRRAGRPGPGVLRSALEARRDVRAVGAP